MARKRKRSQSPIYRLEWWAKRREAIPVDPYHGRAWIAELPAELLEIIAAPLSLTDICATRATCKTLYKTLFGSYVRAFFGADHYFRLLDRGTMQFLCNISENEEVARYVRCLRFSADTIDPARYNGDHQRCRVNRQTVFNTGSLKDYGLFHLDTLPIDPEYDEKSFFERDLQFMLVTLFANLGRLGIALHLNLHDKLGRTKTCTIPPRSAIQRMEC